MQTNLKLGKPSREVLKLAEMLWATTHPKAQPLSATEAPGSAGPTTVLVEHKGQRPCTLARVVALGLVG